VLNPSRDAWEKSELELVVAASKDAILMVEGEANELSEDDMMEALMYAHDSIKEFCSVIDTMTKECGKTKREWNSSAANATMLKKLDDYNKDARETLSITDKQERTRAISALTKKITTDAKANPTAFGLTEGDDVKKEAAKG